MPRQQTSDYACQYRVLDSPVHRLGGGWKLLIGTILSAVAVSAREPWQLGAVLVLILVYYFAARLSVSDLWRDTRFFLLQGVIVTGLYNLSYGFKAGTWPGIRTSLQLLLALVPGMIFLRTTQATALMRGLKKVLPYQITFLVSTSLRFVPFFARELREIALAQRLRGARISFRRLWTPGSWQDLFQCLLLPLMVRALKTAEEAALSAEARGFGSAKVRSYWTPVVWTGTLIRQEKMTPAWKDKNMDKTDNIILWKRFNMREAILLGFCATFIVLTRAGLRLHLHLPGHAMFFLMFFLLLARGCVPKMGAATLVGLITGLVSILLGITGSPLILLKFLIPAALVDLGGFIYPRFSSSYWACILLGVFATASRALSVMGIEWLVGMETEIIMQKALMTVLANSIYGGLGAALVPAIVRRLKANNLIALT